MPSRHIALPTYIEKRAWRARDSLRPNHLLRNKKRRRRNITTTTWTWLIIAVIYLALFSRSVAVCAMVSFAYFAGKTMTQSLVYGNPYYCAVPS